jgi:hypothetical protein
MACVHRSVLALLEGGDLDVQLDATLRTSARRSQNQT